MKPVYPGEQLSRATLQKRIAELEVQLTAARREAERANARADLHEKARREAWEHCHAMSLVQSRSTSTPR